jgi:hypothetical protein
MEDQMKTFILIVLATLMMAPISAPADRAEFCAGFEEGYRMVKGDLVIAPLCPLKPITPIGSTDFREGIRAGIVAANSGE